MSSFELTARQLEAQQLCAGDAVHVMLFGGSRSGKTFLLVRNVIMRALKAPKSRHAIFRFRYNHLRASIILDTWPKVMSLAFPGVQANMHQQDGYAEFENGAQVWFAGLDDKERTEKILGMEFATLYFNECSQIPANSIDTALTRLAQRMTWRYCLASLLVKHPAMPLPSYARFTRHCSPAIGAGWGRTWKSASSSGQITLAR